MILTDFEVQELLGGWPGGLGKHRRPGKESGVLGETHWERGLNVHMALNLSIKGTQTLPFLPFLS